ncbi:MAG: metallophosphoesterase family protein [Actinomycetota bacterium]
MRRALTKEFLLAAVAIISVVAGCSDRDPEIPIGLRGSPKDNVITIAVAGDVCEAPRGDTGGCLATSDLILSQGADWVLLAGDAQYEDGEIENFETVYESTWGRFKARTLPVPGNHDDYDSGFSSYFADAGLGNPIPQHWTKDLGDWNVIGVDSNKVDDAAGFVQDNLPTPRFDIVMWHHARYSSGSDHGSDDEIDPLWDAASAGGACINFVSHDHTYERLTYEGMHQFLVGTGGSEQHDDFIESDLVTGSEEAIAQVHAVLFMDLYRNGRYEFELIDVSGEVLDSGSGACEA